MKAIVGSYDNKDKFIQFLDSIRCEVGVNPEPRTNIDDEYNEVSGDGSDFDLSEIGSTDADSENDEIDSYIGFLDSLVIHFKKSGR